MGLVSEHMKAKKILEDVENKKITSYEEVLKRLGNNNDFYKIWAKNIWELRTTEAPSADLKVRIPSRLPIKKEWKILCNKTEELYVINCYTVQEAFEVVKNHLGDDGMKDYWYKQLDDSFKRKVIKLSV